MGNQSPKESRIEETIGPSGYIPTSFHNLGPRRRMTQNYLVVWLDDKLNTSHPHFSKMTAPLKEISNEVHCCRTSDECVAFLKEVSDEKVFIISSGSLGKELVPRIHDMENIVGIYIFCSNRSAHESWSKHFRKVVEVVTNIEPICASLKRYTQQCDRDLVPINFLPSSILKKLSSNDKNICELEPAIVYSLLLKYTLMNYNNDEAPAKNEFFNYYKKIGVLDQKLKHFLSDFNTKTPLHCVTHHKLLFSMLNRALRAFDLEAIIKLRFVFAKLHEELLRLHQIESDDFKQKNIFYRGQGFTEDDFSRLKKCQGNGLISFSNFLSATKIMKVAKRFAENSTKQNPSMKGIIFIMKINLDNYSKSVTPFADIQTFTTGSQEEEILFSLHSIFTVDEIVETTDNPLIYEVSLTLVDENHQLLQPILGRVRELANVARWCDVAQQMVKLGHYAQAIILYNELFMQYRKDYEQAQILVQIAWLKDKVGAYQEAIMLYSKALEIQRKDPQLEDALTAVIFFNNSQSLSNTGEYANALESSKKAKDCYKNMSNRHSTDLAAAYMNHVELLNNIGDYSKAFDYIERKAEKIYRDSFAEGTYQWATFYNSMGRTYYNMGDYKKALDCYEMDIKISEETLPPNHFDLATSYLAVASIYADFDEYTKVTEYFDKGIKIYEQILPTNHPSLATAYNNYGDIMHRQGNQKKALELYQQAINIYDRRPLDNQLCIAAVLNNLGQLHSSMGEYQKATDFHRKALLTFEHKLPPNHPDLATSYTNMGQVYKRVGQLRKALEYHEKSLEIRRKALPENHPSLAISEHDIGLVYDSLKDYSKAREHYQRAVKIAKASPSVQHTHRKLYDKRLQEISNKT